MKNGKHKKIPIKKFTQKKNEKIIDPCKRCIYSSKVCHVANCLIIGYGHEHYNDRRTSLYRCVLHMNWYTLFEHYVNETIEYRKPNENKKNGRRKRYWYKLQNYSEQTKRLKILIYSNEHLWHPLFIDDLYSIQGGKAPFAVVIFFIANVNESVGKRRQIFIGGLSTLQQFTDVRVYEKTIQVN